jgi:hypothetical protein
VDPLSIEAESGADENRRPPCSALLPQSSRQLAQGREIRKVFYFHPFILLFLMSSWPMEEMEMGKRRASWIFERKSGDHCLRNISLTDGAATSLSRPV